MWQKRVNQVFRYALIQAFRQLKGFANRNRTYLATHAATGDLQSMLRFDLNRLIPTRFTQSLEPYKQQIIHLAELFCGHEIDLLGSGWININFSANTPCCGLEGYSFTAQTQDKNEGPPLSRRQLQETQYLRSLIGKNFEPINWHLDFKSGYRWPARISSRKIRFGNVVGADIKVPWELARLQHLPQLALAYCLIKNQQNPESVAQRYLDEFQNQVLDFFASNPVGHGVNWVCPMEVALRSSSLVVAYDLFRAGGAVFDSVFQKIMVSSILTHAEYVISNLEWSPYFRNNHYLANIIGVLFASVYLPPAKLTDAWLVFSIHELIAIMQEQFQHDGSYFEASTSYHCFALEMVAYATAFVLGLAVNRQTIFQEPPRIKLWTAPARDLEPLPLYQSLNHLNQSPFPFWYFERLAKAAEMVVDITKPNGQLPQIGDNDSGRFLKLQPTYWRTTVGEAKARYQNLSDYRNKAEGDEYWDEDVLDYRHVVSACNGLLQRADFSKFLNTCRLEESLIRSIVGRSSLEVSDTITATVSDHLVSSRARGTSWEHVRNSITSTAGYQSKRTLILTPGGDNTLNLKATAYPCFGIFLFRSPRVYMLIRCGPVGQNGFGGHAHNDQLSLELNVDGQDWIIDPGSYIYTPIPCRRQHFRSVNSHFAPQHPDKLEPNPLDYGLFRLPDRAQAACIFFGLNGFAGSHVGWGIPIYRLIEIQPAVIAITDVLPSAWHNQLHDQDERVIQGRCDYSGSSPGYGKIMR